MPYQPYRSPDPFTTLRGNLRRAGVPVTLSMIAGVVICFLADFFAGLIASRYLGGMIDHSHITNFWSVITYPFAFNSILTVLLGGYWLWSIGGSLERSWGGQRYGLYMVGFTLLIAFCLWLGCVALRTEYPLGGLIMLLAVLTVSWASISPHAPCMFLIFPMKAWVVGAIVVVLLYFGGFMGQPVLGLFALLPCLAAWWYVAGGFSSGYSFRGYAKRGPDLKMTSSTKKSLDGSRSGFSISGWLKERKEKQKLKDLWRNSGLEDKDLRR